MTPDDTPPATIDAIFRNGSLTAVSVVVGFSLTFLTRWAGVPGAWDTVDLVALAVLVPGIACQIAALTRLLSIRSLRLAHHDRSVTVFLAGIVLVTLGIALAIGGDLAGLSQRILG